MDKSSSFQLHPFPPVCDKNSKILILGSFPSVRSRAEGFFYGHPRNRFWRVIAAVLGAEVPESIDEKKRLLLENGIALWDAAASCEIHGSSDASMKRITPNDLDIIFKTGDIKKVFANGKQAGDIYRAYLEKKTGLPITVLPSTSPANAAFSEEELVKRWKCIII